MMSAVDGRAALHADAHATERTALLAGDGNPACISAHQEGNRNGHARGNDHATSVDGEFDRRLVRASSHRFRRNSVLYPCRILYTIMYTSGVISFLFELAKHP